MSHVGGFFGTFFFFLNSEVSLSSLHHKGQLVPAAALQGNRHAVQASLHLVGGVAHGGGSVTHQTIALIKNP